MQRLALMILALVATASLVGCDSLTSSDSPTAPDLLVSWPATQTGNTVSTTAQVVDGAAGTVYTHTWSPQGLNVESDSSTGPVNRSFDWSTWCSSQSGPVNVTLTLQTVGDGKIFGPQSKTFRVCET